MRRRHASSPGMIMRSRMIMPTNGHRSWRRLRRRSCSGERRLTRRSMSNMPLRARAVPRNSALRLHERFRFGDLVSFSVLDGRQYRSKQPCELPATRRGHTAPDSCTERVDPDRTLPGPEQEQWLFEGFKQSDAAWNILAQEQLVADLRQKDRLGAYGHWTDGWDGYPAARQRMLDAMV